MGHATISLPAVRPTKAHAASNQLAPSYAKRQPTRGTYKKPKNKKFEYLSAVAVCLFLLFSCADGNEKREQWISSEIKIVLDTINRSSVIACYQETESFSVLVFGNADKKTARKLTFRQGYPVYVDSLICIRRDKYNSKRFNTTYLIRSSTVISINFVKIIHPSSNWQGQTPWSQPYVNTFPRLDIH